MSLPPERDDMPALEQPDTCCICHLPLADDEDEFCAGCRRSYDFYTQPNKQRTKLPMEERRASRNP
jgi:predicted amidophosphoribosyltransferase